MRDNKKIVYKAFTLVEVIIVVMFSISIMLVGSNLLGLVVAQKASSKTEYDIQSTFRNTSDIILSEIREAGQIIMLSDGSFDKNNLEKTWDYIGIEKSSTNNNDVIYYKYDPIAQNHIRKILSKSDKAISYSLDFKKFALENRNKLLEFTIQAYVGENSTTPKEKLVTEAEAINTSKISKDPNGSIVVDSSGNTISHAIKFMKLQAPRVNVWITLVLDTSGSMITDMDGKETDDPNLSKTRALRKAVSELLILCNKNPNIEINIVPFDDAARGDGIWFNAEYDADLLTTYFDYSISSLNNSKHPLTPKNYTNMGDGIRIGYGNLLTRSDDEKADDVKRYFIVFSDGDSNTYTASESTGNYMDTIGNRTQMPLNVIWDAEIAWPGLTPSGVKPPSTKQPAYNGLTLEYGREEAFEYVKALADNLDPNFVKSYLIGVSSFNGPIKFSDFNDIGVRMHALDTVLTQDPEALEVIFKAIAEDAIEP